MKNAKNKNLNPESIQKELEKYLPKNEIIKALLRELKEEEKEDLGILIQWTEIGMIETMSDMTDNVRFYINTYSKNKDETSMSLEKYTIYTENDLEQINQFCSFLKRISERYNYELQPTAFEIKDDMIKQLRRLKQLIELENEKTSK